MRYFLVAIAVALALTGIASPQSIPFPGPGGVAGLVPIGIPQNLGTPHVAISGNTSALTTSVNVLNGDLLVAQVCITSSTVLSVLSVTDGTNSYAKAVASNEAANYDCELWYKANAAAVTSGASLTATSSSSLAGGAPALSIQAIRVSGIISSPLDKINAQATISAAPSVTTGILSHANELVVGAAFNDASTSETPPTGFTSRSTSSQSGYGTSQDSMIVTSSTSSVTYNPTWGTSGHVITLVATFAGN